MLAVDRRKQIRDALKSELQSQLAELPTLQVFTQQRARVDEGVEHYINIFFFKGDVSRRTYESRGDNADLVIQISTVLSDAVEDHLDSIGKNVEIYLAANPYLGGLLDDSSLREWRYGMDENTGHSWLGLVYKVNFETES